MTTPSELKIEKLFRVCVKLDGSELHLLVGKPPMIHVDGKIRPLNRGPIDDEEMLGLSSPLLNERANKQLKLHEVTDFDYALVVDTERWRFRVTLLQVAGHISLTARVIDQRSSGGNNRNNGEKQ